MKLSNSLMLLGTLGALGYMGMDYADRTADAAACKVEATLNGGAHAEICDEMRAKARNNVYIAAGMAVAGASLFIGGSAVTRRFKERKKS